MAESSYRSMDVSTQTRKFFSEHILSSAHPTGKVRDYVIKIEFQMQGSPHAHCILWIEDVPKINHDSDEAVCNFVDKYITAMIPENNTNHRDIRLMQNLQKHVYLDYCQRNRSCHFGFPKPPAPQTVISCPPQQEDTKEMIKSAKSILHRVQEYLMCTDIDIENTSIEQVLQSLELNIDTYLQSLKVSQHGTSIILK